jgi:ATP-dependent Clp protease ATP-binding subunit ClpA
LREPNTGEFEERLKSVVKEVLPKEILFYSLMRFTLVGAGVARGYGCSKYFEASFGSWRTARYGATTLMNTKSISKRQSTRKTFPENNYRRTRYRKRFQSCVVSKI